MLWIILSLLGAAGAAPALVRRFPHAGYALAAVPFAGLCWLLFGLVPGSSEHLAWFSRLGADLSFRADPLGWTMALLVTGIGTFIVIYATAYLSDDPQRGRFLAILFAFTASMVGVVLADNVLLLFVFWELTSITSYLLIGYKHESKEARRHALQALLVTGFGGVAMLIGMLLLVAVTGTWKISEMAGMGAQITSAPTYGAILALVLLGAFTKSAQFPFHFWLPNAMSAPTPVSAFLHSATMVKAGVFLLARMDPLLGGTPQWQGLLLGAGLITFLLGAVAGYCQTDLKRVLAYTTCGILGALTALLALPGEKARAAFMLLLVAHALYKATLFMVVGGVDHATHTRDWRKLGRLAGSLPVTAAAALLAAASKAGLPPLVGFLAKEKGYMATLEGLPGLAWLVTAGMLLGNALMVALAVRVGWGPFWQRPRLEPAKPSHGVGVGLVMGPVVLAAIGILFGAWPVFTQAFFLEPVLKEWLNLASVAPLKLWHGINLPLVLSVFTLAGGFALHALSRSERWVRVSAFSFADPVERAYEAGLAGTIRWGGWMTRHLQSGDLRQYAAVILGATILLVGFPLARHGFLPERLTVTPLEIVPSVAALLIAAGAVGAVLARQRFLVLIWLSVVGFATAWWFLYYSGPDLALTLLSVETITVLLLALSVRRVPDPILPTGRWVRLGRAAIATASGLVVAVLLLKAKWIQLGEGVGAELLARSVPDGKGTNAVNVILVDFRALDTFGEITVLLIAAFGVAALIAGSRKTRETEVEP